MIQSLVDLGITSARIEEEMVKKEMTRTKSIPKLANKGFSYFSHSKTGWLIIVH